MLPDFCFRFASREQSRQVEKYRLYSQTDLPKFFDKSEIGCKRKFIYKFPRIYLTTIRLPHSGLLTEIILRLRITLPCTKTLEMHARIANKNENFNSKHRVWLLIFVRKPFLKCLLVTHFLLTKRYDSK